MAFTQTLILVMIGLSASVFFLKDRTSAVLTYGAISVSAVVVFSMYAAPDVALAEASIGLVFTLFLYMVTLQHKGKLWFGLVEINKAIDDLEMEIIEDYCKTHELELKVVKVSEDDVLEMLKSGKIEVAGAALLKAFAIPGIKMTEGFLETKVFTFGKIERSQAPLSFETKKSFKEKISALKDGKKEEFHIDLIRYISLPFSNEEMPKPTSEKKDIFYAFGVVEDEEELFQSINEYLKEIKESGKLKNMIERHVR
jgi:uncharacterized MnhB-related membrane protein